MRLSVYLKVFASVLGVDQFLTFLGVPNRARGSLP